MIAVGDLPASLSLARWGFFMKKIPLYLSSCEFPSTAIARVCLAVAKTNFEVAWQCRNRRNATGADLNPAVLGPFFR